MLPASQSSSLSSSHLVSETVCFRNLFCNEANRTPTYSRVAALGDRTEVQARKFYSQRNMYLCGFTLFLSLILNRTYVMILELLRLEDKVRFLEGSKKASDKDSAPTSPGEMSRLRKEIDTLKKQNEDLKKIIEQKDRDIDALKEQAKGLSREYNRLGDQMSTEDGSNKKER
jgi:B-cell receptor-associated protein 31